MSPSSPGTPPGAWEVATSPSSVATSQPAPNGSLSNDRWASDDDHVVDDSRSNSMFAALDAPWSRRSDSHVVDVETAFEQTDARIAVAIAVSALLATARATDGEGVPPGRVHYETAQVSA